MEAIIKAAPDCDKATAQEIGNLFRECLTLNDQCNRVVHGSWSFREEDPATLTARHVSRQTPTGKEYFITVVDIELVVVQAGNPKASNRYVSNRNTRYLAFI